MPAFALIVEDDGPTRQALSQILEREGFTVDMAVDGEEAVGCFAQRRYELILLGIVLPEMSGTDVMERLAMTTPEQLGRVIVVTGLDVQEIRNLFPTVK